MPAPVFTRPGLIGATVLAVITSFGSAIRGETRRISAGPAAAASIDALKAEHSRPASIPFPEQNPYTLAKAVLGKKLYFDPRLSATSAQSCASCLSPGFGWGDGLARGVGHRMTKLIRRSATIVNSARVPIFMWERPRSRSRALRLVPPGLFAGAR
jgi:cytochrome c peroxidase